MDSCFSPKDEIWFLRVCHYISNAVYHTSDDTCDVIVLTKSVFFFNLDFNGGGSYRPEPPTPSSVRPCYRISTGIDPLNAELNPICHLLVLLGAHPILHISRIRVKG